jgi:hypothetical protein
MIASTPPTERALGVAEVIEVMRYSWSSLCRWLSSLPINLTCAPQPAVKRA